MISLLRFGAGVQGVPSGTQAALPPSGTVFIQHSRKKIFKKFRLLRTKLSKREEKKPQKKKKKPGVKEII